MGVSFDALMEPFLCPVCADKTLPVSSPLCTMCGQPFESDIGEDHLCGQCIMQPRHFSQARAVGIYDESLMGVIHCLKYKGQTELARPLARLLFRAFLDHGFPDETDLVVPVPLHPRRLRARGFNQAFLLIRPWPKWWATTREASRPLSISKGLLVRKQDTSPQTQLGREKRHKNVKHAFAVSEKVCLSDQRVLLVDDVYTTGATVDACAGVLLKAGAKKVDVLTLARTS